MQTETFSPRFEELDRWSSLDAAAAMFEGQLAAVAALSPALPAIAAAADAAAARLNAGGRLVYAGAGTSGRIGVQDGTELTPTFDWPEDRLAFAMAGGDSALSRSSEGAEDDRGAAIEACERLRIGADDVVIGIAASGRTPFTIALIETSRAAGALTIALANNGGTPLLTAAEHAILVETGPEVLAGSTRMKAGTAQKAVLNILSTLVMIRLGRVYRGLMVDMRARNAKLLKRSEAMVDRLTGCGPQAAAEAVTTAGGEIKLAVLIAAGAAPNDALRMLDESGGDLRGAMVAAGLPPVEIR